MEARLIHVIFIKVNAIDVTSNGDMYALGQADRIIIGNLSDGKEEVNMGLSDGCAQS